MRLRWKGPKVANKKMRCVVSRLVIATLLAAGCASPKRYEPPDGGFQTEGDSDSIPHEAADAKEDASESMDGRRPQEDAGKDAAACAPEGIRLCSQDRQEVLRCEGGQWRHWENCANVCTSGECGGECKPGRERCGAQRLRELCGESGNWGAEETCEYVCSLGKCIGECLPDSRRCNATTNSAELCDGSGAWQAPASAGCGLRCIGEGICEQLKAGRWTGQTAASQSYAFTVAGSGNRLTSFTTSTISASCGGVASQTYLVDVGVVGGVYSFAVGDCPRVETSGRFSSESAADGTIRLVWDPTCACVANAPELTWRAAWQ